MFGINGFDGPSDFNSQHSASSEASSEKDGLKKISRQVGGIAAGAVELRNFLGLKVAQEAMDESGALSDVDEPLATAVTGVLSGAAIRGIVLNMRGTVSDADINQAVEDYKSSLPDQFPTQLGEMAKVIIPRGIQFHRDEFKPDTPKSQQWIADFFEQYDPGAK